VGNRYTVFQTQKRGSKWELQLVVTFDNHPIGQFNLNLRKVGYFREVGKNVGFYKFEKDEVKNDENLQKQAHKIVGDHLNNVPP